MESMKKIQIAQCGDCGNIHEKVPTVSAGDESWNVCPDCRTTEGTWHLLENCDCNPEAAICIPEKIESQGSPECPVCKGEGWLKQ